MRCLSEQHSMFIADQYRMDYDSWAGFGFPMEPSAEVVFVLIEEFRSTTTRPCSCQRRPAVGLPLSISSTRSVVLSFCNILEKETDREREAERERVRERMYQNKGVK